MCEVQAARGAALKPWGPRLIAAGIALAVLGVDQVTKAVAIERLEPGEPVNIVGEVLRFTLIRNPGAAFGMGSGFTVVLTVIAILALLACVIVGLPRVRRSSEAVALGLLTGGIAGNLHDRLLREPGPLRGHVIDFFQLPNFAIFNVADIGITSAAGLIILLSFTHEKQRTAGAA